MFDNKFIKAKPSTYEFWTVIRKTKVDDMPWLQSGRNPPKREKKMIKYRRNLREVKHHIMHVCIVNLTCLKLFMCILPVFFFVFCDMEMENCLRAKMIKGNQVFGWLKAALVNLNLNRPSTEISNRRILPPISLDITTFPTLRHLCSVATDFLCFCHKTDTAP